MKLTCPKPTTIAKVVAAIPYYWMLSRMLHHITNISYRLLPTILEQIEAGEFCGALVIININLIAALVTGVMAIIFFQFFKWVDKKYA
jgi:hypothetical protein